MLRSVLALGLHLVDLVLAVGYHPRLTQSTEGVGERCNNRNSSSAFR